MGVCVCACVYLSMCKCVHLCMYRERPLSLNLKPSIHNRLHGQPAPRIHLPLFLVMGLQAWWPYLVLTMAFTMNSNSSLHASATNILPTISQALRIPFFKALWQHINGLERWLSAEEYLLLFQGPKFSSQHPHLVVHGYP